MSTFRPRVAAFFIELKIFMALEVGSASTSSSLGLPALASASAAFWAALQSRAFPKC